ncbi:DUF3301 domain-containing protein [Saccharobesus litoralis]|uniref:DUF3301 domain-containing protein n=1 Tax=Saccharobesus litoralis TaxID=2172099 RepID=A0A2S0VTV3_9ALTE|nr:DUF3301 domain-containing protein [Saccharobesus litoralis]AWB67646.1 DUF3301 domain-containing protein [Saccharobesus litoralis]
MQVLDILILALILAVCMQFWQLRKQAEQALLIAQNYCEKNNLQFISCARSTTKLCFFKQQFAVWQSQYIFEFSGNGEDKAQGHLTIENQRLIDISCDAYRI